MNLQEEIDFVVSVLTHPAGYNLGLFGTLGIRSTDQLTWEVEWEAIDNNHWKSFDNPVDAATFFVKFRHQHEMGLDIEAELFRKNKTIS